MDSDKAYSTMWPFNRNRGLSGRPIGGLLEAGLLAERDLRWAAQNARDGAIRSACALLLQQLDPPGRVVWQDLPVRGEPLRVVECPAIPEACPLCGSPTRREPRWDSPRGPGWRCERGGPSTLPPSGVAGQALAHFLETAYLPILKEVFAPDAWVIPPAGDHPGVRRRDLAGGPIGYWPASNQ